MKTGRYGRRVFGAASVVLSLVLNCVPGFAAEVNGIWTDNTTTDVGTATGIKALEGIKTRGWVSTYYDYKFGNASNNTAITGRTFDTRNESFNVELAELEVEKVPATGGVGFKVDLAAGDTMDQIETSVRAANGTGSMSNSENVLQHATVAYLADIGKGLRIDLGKMVTHIGGETIEGIKNNNFSHSFYYTYAIPFNETGIRLNYTFNDHFTGEFYLTNDWNSTIAQNKGKSFGPSVDWTFGPFSGVVNYMAGLASDTQTGFGGAVPANAARSTMRQLVDTQVFYTWKALNLGLNVDYGTQNGVPLNNGTSTINPTANTNTPYINDKTRTVKWYGWTWYARYKINDNMEPSLRFETYVDPNGFTTLQNGTVMPAGSGASAADLAFRPGATRFYGTTFTWNQKVAKHLLVRPEFRWDRSNRRTTLFTDNHGRSISSQETLALNAVYYF